MDDGPARGTFFPKGACRTPGIPSELSGCALLLLKPSEEQAVFACEPSRPTWHDIRFAELTYQLEDQEPPMGEVVRFVPKAELERARLIREARANYERVFPPTDSASERQESDK